MRTIPFSKYSGNGNDFIILDNPQIMITPELVTGMCNRNFGIGADGVLVLTNESHSDGKMGIYNADGGEAEMCANGLRCLVTYVDKKNHQAKDEYFISTMNSKYKIQKHEGTFAIEMSELRDKNLYDLSAFHEFEKCFYINTGVPHLVFLAKEVDKIKIKETSARYRYHNLFPRGTNVNYVELAAGPQTAKVRTYERGVEDETHSCGTGLTATAHALNFWYGWENSIELHTKGGKQNVNLSNGRTLYSGEVKFCFEGNYPL